MGLLLVFAVSWSGCGHYPPTPPPKIVEVVKPCSVKVPKIDPPVWPDPNPDGSTTLTKETSVRVLVLLTVLANTIEEYRATCGETD
jgi:hypothetical protein